MTHRIINRADLDLYTAADCDETCGADSPKIPADKAPFPRTFPKVEM